ncbi:hypothetical protein JKL50_03615 [Bacillus altitudinis]|uniref:S8 family serine peptidase n=1 Tax=Bacillus altitudinis TaxID=293387 RepID=UPI00192B91F0|nr:S8 family serine peptidase [Bacillus altitudinis]QQX15216.1 hypothetical protein JKL50_03615 [Bacillus altitudinis]
MKNKFLEGDWIKASKKGKREQLNKAGYVLKVAEDDILVRFLSGNTLVVPKSWAENLDEALIVVISSVGNYGLQEKSDILYPAKFKGVIAVGALNMNGDIWKGRTVGNGLNVLLPGHYKKLFKRWFFFI